MCENTLDRPAPSLNRQEAMHNGPLMAKRNASTDLKAVFQAAGVQINHRPLQPQKSRGNPAYAEPLPRHFQVPHHAWQGKWV